MSKLDGIINMLEEDAEYDVVEYIRNNRNSIENTPIYNWNDRRRRLAIVTDEVASDTYLAIRDYSVGLGKVYFADRVEISLKDIEEVS